MPEAAKLIEAVEPEKPATITRIRPKEIVIDLGTPVMAHGDMVSKLTFRRPTGGDIMAMTEGYPINIDWRTGQISVNPPLMGQMMSVLAAVPPSTIKALDSEDWSTCAHALMSFFPPGSQAMQFLNCYRLAKTYSRNPDEFLAMPLDDVERHVQWTEEMLAASELTRTRDG